MTTYAELQTLVRHELSDHTQAVSARITVSADDDLTKVFHLPHENVEVSAVYLDDVLKTLTTHYSVDEFAGTVTFVTAPGEDAVIVVPYTYTLWREEDIQQAILDAVYHLFPEFYVCDLQTDKADSGTITLATFAAGSTVTVNGLVFTGHASTTTVANREFTIAGDNTADAAALAVCINAATYGVPGVTATSALGVVTLECDSDAYVLNMETEASTATLASTATTFATTAGTYEYALRSDTEAVAGIDWRTSSAYPWKRLKTSRYDVERDSETTYLRFHDNPPTGYFRVHAIKRPAPFAYDSDSLTSLGLNERAVRPIVLYACYRLLKMKLARRVRVDVAHTTQGEGNVPPYEVARAVNAYLMAYAAELAQCRMTPWSVR